MQSEMFGLGVKNELVVSSHLMNPLFSQTQVKSTKLSWRAVNRSLLGELNGKLAAGGI